MATMTFQVNDASTASGYPAVWVSIAESGDGTLSFRVWQEGGIVGDLRGLFFDVADEGILKSLVVNATSSDIRIGDDSIRDLGDGANMNGLTGSDKGYDVGIEIGTAGIGKDDIQSYSFTLQSTARALTLNDFSGVDFGARLTSVGVVGGARADSSKILEITSQAADAHNDLAVVDENHTASGNVLANDATGGGTTSVTGWSGGAFDANGASTVVLSSEGDQIGTLTLKTDGSYVLNADTLDADKLSAGESIVYTFNYDLKNQTEATSWSIDSATFTVVVNGVNDGPVAHDDSTGCVDENTSNAGGSVVANDTDVDRLDTLSFVSWADGSGTQSITNGAGATARLNADGTWSVDASAADALSQGEHLSQSFAYTMTDNHGATSTAALTVEVCGVNDGPDAQDDNAGCITEDGQIVNASVTANDSDVDRLDTHSYALVEDSFNGSGNLTFNADGTWSYDANGAYDSLNDGQHAELSFQYTMTDNHGASDTATVSFCIEGNGTIEPPPPPPHVDQFPGMAQAISNVVLYLDNDNQAGGLFKVKISPPSDNYFDVDNLDIAGFLATHVGSTGKDAAGNDVAIGTGAHLVGISVHAGQEYPNDAAYDGTRSGEGAFYFLANNDVTAIGHRGSTGGWVHDWSQDSVPLDQYALAAGFTDALLQQHSTDYAFDGNWYS